MPRLPKPGTHVENLKCPKCKKTLAEVTAQEPVGVVHCDETDCPQKPKEQSGG